MPLSLDELKDLQAEAMADDVDIDLEKMSLWSASGSLQPPFQRPSLTPSFPVVFLLQVNR